MSGAEGPQLLRREIGEHDADEEADERGDGERLRAGAVERGRDLAPGAARGVRDRPIAASSTTWPASRTMPARWLPTSSALRPSVDQRIEERAAQRAVRRARRRGRGDRRRARARGRAGGARAACAPTPARGAARRRGRGAGRRSGPRRRAGRTARDRAPSARALRLERADVPRAGEARRCARRPRRSRRRSRARVSAVARRADISRCRARAPRSDPTLSPLYSARARLAN